MKQLITSYVKARVSLIFISRFVIFSELLLTILFCIGKEDLAGKIAYWILGILTAISVLYIVTRFLLKHFAEDDRKKRQPQNARKSDGSERASDNQKSNK